MDQDQFNQALIEFLAASPTPFHAVAQMASRLADTGFERLDESEAWQLVPGVAIGSAVTTRPLLPGGCQRAVPCPRVAFAWSALTRIPHA